MWSFSPKYSIYTACRYIFFLRGHRSFLFRRLRGTLRSRPGFGFPLGHGGRTPGPRSGPGPRARSGDRRGLGLGPSRGSRLGGRPRAGASAGPRLRAAVARSAAGPGTAPTPGSAAATPPRAAAPASVATAAVSAGWRSPAAVVRVRGAAVARHLYPQLAAVQHGPVHGIHGVLGVTLIMEADEGEAAGLLSVAVPRDVHVADAPVLLEDAPQRVGRGAVGQVVHLEGGHTLHVGRGAAVAHGSERRPGAPRTGAGFFSSGRCDAAASVVWQLPSAWGRRGRP